MKPICMSYLKTFPLETQILAYNVLQTRQKNETLAQPFATPTDAAEAGLMLMKLRVTDVPKTRMKRCFLDLRNFSSKKEHLTNLAICTAKFGSLNNSFVKRLYKMRMQSLCWKLYQSEFLKASTHADFAGIEEKEFIKNQAAVSTAYHFAVTLICFCTLHTSQVIDENHEKLTEFFKSFMISKVFENKTSGNAFVSSTEYVIGYSLFTQRLSRLYEMSDDSDGETLSTVEMGDITDDVGYYF